MPVELIRIGDELSVRLDGVEVFVLPKRKECSIETLKRAFDAVEAQTSAALLANIDVEDSEGWE